MLCFAYGSNLSSRRLQSRVSSARILGVGTLPGHQLRFHKFSRRDLSAKCDAYWTGEPEDFVLGVLFELDRSDKTRLDEIEGLHQGYEEKTTAIHTPDGAIAEVQLYIAQDINPALVPFDWYKHHVLIGAREHGFPTSYLERIDAVPSKPDRDRERSNLEFSIYPSDGDDAVRDHRKFR